MFGGDRSSPKKQEAELEAYLFQEELGAATVGDLVERSKTAKQKKSGAKREGAFGERSSRRGGGALFELPSSILTSPRLRSQNGTHVWSPSTSSLTVPSQVLFGIWPPTPCHPNCSFDSRAPSPRAPFFPIHKRLRCTHCSCFSIPQTQFFEICAFTPYHGCFRMPLFLRPLREVVFGITWILLHDF